MKEKKYAINDYVTAQDIKNSRKKLKLTQKDFAKAVGVSTPTIERWEAGDGKIKGPIVTVLKMLDLHPECFSELIVPEKTTPLRLYYMHNQNICTVIDVDESNHMVHIQNYTNKLLFRAFGVKEKPTYEDYQDFLKSRVFPETRDKLKLVLEDLDIPFYDPFLIIEKTEGRMAEDHFWIKIER